MKPSNPGPTNDDLRKAESCALDVLSVIGMAIAHRVILGVNIANITGANGAASPGLAIFLPGEKATIPGTDDGPVRQLRLTIPQDGVNFLGLFASANDFCHGLMCKAHESGDVDCTYYFVSKQEIEKCRRDAKPRIIMPGRSLN